MKIKYTEKITKGLEKEMGAIFEEHEKNFDILCNFKKFGFTIKNQNKELLAGVTGYTAFSEVHIDDICVKKDCRNKKYGTLLLKKVEEYFQKKGFDNINLFTNEFQAPEFYKKCGFELEFVRKHQKNTKFNKYYFVKKLN